MRYTSAGEGGGNVVFLSLYMEELFDSSQARKLCDYEEYLPLVSFYIFRVLYLN